MLNSPSHDNYFIVRFLKSAAKVRFIYDLTIYLVLFFSSLTSCALLPYPHKTVGSNFPVLFLARQAERLYFCRDL